MNREETSRVVAVLMAVYPDRPVVPGTVAGWALALDDVPYADAMVAAQVWIKTSRFFPTPSQIRELLAEATAGIPEWEAAWDEVASRRRRRGIYVGERWGNDEGAWSSPAVEAALRLVGGYAAFCAVETGDEGTMRAQFRDAYTRARTAAVRRVQLGDDTPALPGNVRSIADRAAS